MVLHVSEKQYRELKHESAPSPGPGRPEPSPRPTTSPISDSGADDNFWLFTAGGVIALFLLYITKKGELKTWAEILMYQPTPPITVEGGGSGTAKSGAEMPANAPVRAGIPNALSGGLIGAPGNLGTPIAPGGQSVLQYFFNKWFNVPTGQRFFGGGPPV